MTSAIRHIPSARLARQLGLFLIALFATQGLVSGMLGGPVGGSTFFLCLYIHLWVSIYDGLFDKVRKCSWVLLSLGWAGAIFNGFLGYVLPWGQMTGWLAAEIAGIAASLPGGEHLVEVLSSLDGWFNQPMLAHLSAMSLPALLLVLDIFIMHGREWIARWRAAPRSGRMAVLRGDLILVASALIIGMATALYQGAPPAGALTDDTLSFTIVPEWSALPPYAILRCVPDKLFGVLLMFAAILLPVVTPWVGSAQCRIGPTRWWFAASCAALAGSWVMLAALGAEEPTDAVNWQIRVLAFYYFAFFVVLVPLLSLWERRRLARADRTVLQSFE
jgi:ubiquinol-cytochrome c reductase cytochrome b subunit